MKAIWNGQVIAESNNTVQIEGNHYFPADSVKKEFLKESDHKSMCPLERHSFLLFVRCKWRRKQKCRLVLSNSKRCR